MNRQKLYWFTGILIAVILILAIFLNNNRNGQENQDTDTHTGHSSENYVTGESDSAGQDPSTGSSREDSEALNAYLEEQKTIMTDMMEAMKVEATGNASVDFLKGMIPHHESAIEMSESYLKYGGSNSELKQLANDIISAQTDEIDQMNKLIEEINASGETDAEKEKGYLNAYDQMMSGHEHMQHGAAAAKDVEDAFADGMLMHHQMAVDMSKAIIDYTDHEEVKKLAETIIAAQEKEIKQLKEIGGQ